MQGGRAKSTHTPDPGFPWLVLVRSASHNNYVDSIKQAGLSFCRTEWSVVSNAASAPFDKAGFFCRYVETAKEFLENNDCTNDLFLATYPILSLDQSDGVLPDGFNSPEHTFYVEAFMAVALLLVDGIVCGWQGYGKRAGPLVQVQ